MRLLVKEAAPWVASLDRDPVPLRAPAVLLRTPPTGDADSPWRRRCPGPRSLPRSCERLVLNGRLSAERKAIHTFTIIPNSPFLLKRLGSGRTGSASHMIA